MAIWNALQSYDYNLQYFLPETDIYFQFPAKKTTPYNEQWVCFMTAAFIYDHCKKKIVKLGGYMTFLMTVTTYNWNYRLNYGHKSRATFVKFG